MIIECSVTDFELMVLRRDAVPLVVKVRQMLNKKGIRFTDDNRFTSICNTEPQPLGTLKARYDHEKGITFYRQELDDN